MLSGICICPVLMAKSSAEQSADEREYLAKLAKAVFVEPLGYGEALDMIEREAKVQKRQAQAFFTAIRKASFIVQNHRKQWLLYEPTAKHDKS